MPNAVWPFYPLAFLHDAARCLALSNQGQLRLNDQDRLQIGSVSRLARVVSLEPEHPDPRSETKAPGLSFLVGLLGHAGFIAAVDGKLCLTATALEWLGLPAGLQVGQLRQVWKLSLSAEVRWLPAELTTLRSGWRRGRPPRWSSEGRTWRRQTW